MNYNITHPKAWCCAPATSSQLLQLSLRHYPLKEETLGNHQACRILNFTHTQFWEKQHKLLPGVSKPIPVCNWRQPEPGRSKNWKSCSADQRWTVALALFCSWMNSAYKKELYFHCWLAQTRGRAHTLQFYSSSVLSTHTWWKNSSFLAQRATLGSATQLFKTSDTEDYKLK